MANNFRQFQASINRFIKSTVPLDLAKTRKAVSLSLLGKIISKTPVDTGRLRNSWFLSDGVPHQGIGSAGTTPNVNITATFSNPFEASWIVNNLPYATRIEFGHSTVKAPAGMVRVSIAELQAELR